MSGLNGIVILRKFGRSPVGRYARGQPCIQRGDIDLGWGVVVIRQFDHKPSIMIAVKKAIDRFWENIEAFALVDFVFDFALIDPRTNFCLCLVVPGPVVGNQKSFDPRPLDQ